MSRVPIGRHAKEHSLLNGHNCRAEVKICRVTSLSEKVLKRDEQTNTFLYTCFLGFETEILPTAKDLGSVSLENILWMLVLAMVIGSPGLKENSPFLSWTTSLFPMNWHRASTIKVKISLKYVLSHGLIYEGKW